MIEQSKKYTELLYSDRMLDKAALEYADLDGKGFNIKDFAVRYAKSAPKTDIYLFAVAGIVEKLRKPDSSLALKKYCGKNEPTTPLRHQAPESNVRHISSAAAAKHANRQASYVATMNVQHNTRKIPKIFQRALHCDNVRTSIWDATTDELGVSINKYRKEIETKTDNLTILMHVLEFLKRHNANSLGELALTKYPEILKLWQQLDDLSR